MNGLNIKERILIAIYNEYNKEDPPDMLNKITPENLGIEKEKFYFALEKLKAEEFIDNRVTVHWADSKPYIISWVDGVMTPKGIEYTEGLLSIDRNVTIPSMNNKENNSQPADVLKILERIFSRFHIIVKELEEPREEKHQPIEVKKEADVNYLLGGLFRIYFDNVEREEPVPKYLGKSARMDFYLPDYKVGIEIKMTRKNLTGKNIGDELLLDVERYNKHKACETFVIFIYDPDIRIKNRDTLIKELEEKSSDIFKIKTYINPEMQRTIDSIPV